MRQLLLLIPLLSSFALAETLEITMNELTTDGDGIGKSVGTITVSETGYGLLFTPHLKGIEPGIHGFHLHQNPSCEKTDKGPGMAAGGHFDPFDTGKHQAPWSDSGHLGDLPALYADKDGNVMQPVLAPRIHDLSQIKNLSIMIHSGGDNYSDTPLPLGGGAARMSCGVIR